ncbi:hypothetical protein K9N68_35545 (plasmid) [Kovacikia minuta CCNUW1]|uniref:hypothetical protein n=1 Tax=Kovacikia minuta TaxID=2931930 RepID=UPI001CC91685|nr:hypothetical protein [Kovacikia minuta]UBF30498.1 hypothetical protein K9N68_35545 [Kovacikia minuta CCNUW1]
MKGIRIVGLVLAVMPLFFAQSAKAEMLVLGTASGGQTIRLDTESIQHNGRSMSWWTGFTYYLGNERLEAGAHCGQKIWRVEGKDYKPQSKATRNMISIVCSARYVEDSEDMGNVIVFDPPSNIRSSPGGAVKCSIDQMTVIQVYVEPRNGWYSTKACGGGWIHQSQVHAFR